MHSNGPPVVAASMVSHLTRSPVFFIEPYLQWWRPAGKSHEPASARSLLDMGDFNQPCHPAEGRNVLPMPQFNQDFPVMRRQRLLLPVWDRTPQLWHPPNWERSCLLQTSLCHPPSPIFEAAVNFPAGKALQGGNFVL